MPKPDSKLSDAGAKPSEDEFLRKTPQQSRSRSVVNALLQAAEQLLERAGDPTQVSLQGIAQRAGVGIGSLYDYFANRDGLLSAFLARVTDTNFAKLEAEVAGSSDRPFTEVLPKLLEAVLSLYLERPERTRATIQTILRLGWMKPVISERDRFSKLMAARLRAEHPWLDEADTALLAEVLSDMVMGVVVSELWRERDATGALAVRRELTEVAVARVTRFLAQHPKPSRESERPAGAATTKPTPLRG